MIKSYLKIAWRSLLKNKGYSLINIGGLAAGMSVAIVIGLWVHDELTFNQYHKNHSRIAQVMQNLTYNGEVGTQDYNPMVLGTELRNSYGNNFSYVVTTSGNNSMSLQFGDKIINTTGQFSEPGIAEMLGFKILKGTGNCLQDPAAILLSSSTAKTFFGNDDPVNKMMSIDNKMQVKVAGVYEDLPLNSSFNEVKFFIPWSLMLSLNPSMPQDDWNGNMFNTYVQLADNANMGAVSAKIKHIKFDHVDKEQQANVKPEIFLQPMSKWHLYSEFKNGKSVGGRITYVWLFGVIGLMVLLLACINFMNLATARSEKRAKEVGVRKAIGSLKGQLIKQFFTESVLVSALAFMVSIILVLFLLPFFNEMAGKQITILWYNPVFWIVLLLFTLLTGFIAGTYPALYLSSFQPVKVLKGTFKAGKFSALPRQILVVVQFTVSIMLVIGVLIVYRQIEFTKNRAVGYMRNGLISIANRTDDIHNHFEAVREELKQSGAIAEMAESHSPVTEVWLGLDGFNWRGKDPNVQATFATIFVSHDFAKTVGWQFIQGRDFSRAYESDSAAFILNEAAAKYMGFKNPLGETVTMKAGSLKDAPYKVIGVIKDMLMESPYDPVSPTIFLLNKGRANFETVKLNPSAEIHTALSKIETVFKKYAPASPFEYKFVDEEYNKKFADEERTGKLASCFAILAILISSLGVFGLAAFTAAQRTKEIGIRKIAGASVFSLWKLLSKDFMALVFISFLIATPLAWYGMNRWLQHYDYRAGISWWIFVAVCFGALLVTLITVSFQAINTALANPVKSLRTE
jgi:ABC-type antimicrobial peptide transport system permease subunit